MLLNLKIILGRTFFLKYSLKRDPFFVSAPVLEINIVGRNYLNLRHSEKCVMGLQNIAFKNCNTWTPA